MFYFKHHMCDFVMCTSLIMVCTSLPRLICIVFRWLSNNLVVVTSYDTHAHTRFYKFSYVLFIFYVFISFLRFRHFFTFSTVFLRFHPYSKVFAHLLKFLSAFLCFRPFLTFLFFFLSFFKT